MKKIYIVILFLVFINVFNFMFVALNIFPHTYSGGDTTYDLGEEDGLPTGEILYENISGYSFGDMASIIFGDETNIAVAIVGATISIAAAWLTRSPAPFVVGMVTTLFITMYRNSLSIFEGMPINNYLFLAGTIGMMIMFTITCAEYLTQGDA